MMSKKTYTPPERQIPLAGFLKEINKPGTRAGFRAVMTGDSACRTRTEWDKLLALYRSRPIAVPWQEWVIKGGR
jgi:hypothetical protein